MLYKQALTLEPSAIEVINQYAQFSCLLEELERAVTLMKQVGLHCSLIYLVSSSIDALSAQLCMKFISAIYTPSTIIMIIIYQLSILI